MAPLVGVGGRTTPVLDEEHPQAFACRPEVLLGVERPEHRVVRDPAVELVHQPAKGFFAPDRLVERGTRHGSIVPGGAAAARRRAPPVIAASQDRTPWRSRTGGSACLGTPAGLGATSPVSDGSKVDSGSADSTGPEGQRRTRKSISATPTRLHTPTTPDTGNFRASRPVA